MYNKLKQPKSNYDPETNRSSEEWGSRMFSLWPVRYAALILSCLMFGVWYYKSYHIPRHSISDSSSWDFLLFTQLYPPSCCVWNKVENRHDFCHFSQDPHAWTVHGIWPTKNNTEGPMYCQRIKFNETALEPIKTQLEDRWPSIDATTGKEFWAHEWKKHGTCAIEDRAVFDSELTYFKLGLTWNGQYNVTSILNKAGITPSNTVPYSKAEFHDAIKSALGKAAYLDCYNYEELGIYLINEIRLCISKSLELLDCDSLYTDTGNCPENQKIFYPGDLS